jgi:hypothetical protein
VRMEQVKTVERDSPVTLDAGDGERQNIEHGHKGDLGLRRGERLVLAVGIHVACAVIATSELSMRLSVRRARARARRPAPGSA